jgi:hypothetical protein
MFAAASAQWNSPSQALLSHRMTSGGIVYAAGAVSRMPQTTKLLSGSEYCLGRSIGESSHARMPLIAKICHAQVLGAEQVSVRLRVVDRDSKCADEVAMLLNVSFLYRIRCSHDLASEDVLSSLLRKVPA